MELLNKSFEISIFSKDAKDLAVDYSELAIDSILDNDILKDMPVIKTILGIYNTGIGIKERFVIRKVAKFLFRLNSISDNEKTKFLNKISTKDSYKNEVIEKLLILLDRLDDIDKAEIIGNLFRVTIEGEIDIDSFYKLSSIVDRTYIVDLKAFCFRYDHDLDREIRNTILHHGLFQMSNETYKILSSLGLMKESIKTQNDRLQHGSTQLNYSFEYATTILGDRLAKYAKPTFRYTEQ